MEVVVALETMESALDFTGDVLDVTEKAIELSAKNNGLHGPYGNGAKYNSEKLTLSLVHQANVVAVKKNTDGTLNVYSGSFTVWSGATDGSTKSYNLSDHLGELSYTTRCLQALIDPTFSLKVIWICALLPPSTRRVNFVYPLHDDATD